MKMFLEGWIHNKIKQSIKIGKVSRNDLEDFQLYRLQRALDYVYEKSSFYRHLFDERKIKPKDVQSLDDLAHIPFTEPTNLAAEPYKLLCVSLGEVKRVFTLSTAGTTGPPKKVFFTQNELEEISDYMGAAMKSVAECGGIDKEGFVVQMLLPDGRPSSQAGLLAKGVRKVGARPALLDISLSPKEQLEAIKRGKPDIIFGSVSRIYRITQESKGNLRDIGVKILFLTSEYLPRAMRERLKEVWDCDVYLHYGMTELGFGGGIECNAHDGFHFNECDFLFEVIDPETGEVLPNGKEGELVFTTLNRVSMPLIRYKTGDISKLTSGGCECGASTLRKIGKVSKRVKSMVKMGKGDEIYIALFDEAVYTVPEVIDYRVILEKDGKKESLIIKAEVTRKGKRVEENIYNAMLKIPQVRGNIDAGRMTEPKVELAKRGTLKRKGREKRTIEERNLNL